MRIFLDVGAHDGQTLEEVCKPEYGFDRIIAFEPMPLQFACLVASFAWDPRVTLLNIALADETGPLPIYGSNEDMEASIYAEKDDVDASFVTTCTALRASDFFADNFSDDDYVIAKINCEGAEAVILADLIRSDEVWKLDHVMVDFDVRKVPGREHLEGQVMAMLEFVGFDRLVLSEEVMQGETHQERIAGWLSGAGVLQ